MTFDKRQGGRASFGVRPPFLIVGVIVFLRVVGVVRVVRLVLILSS